MVVIYRCPHCRKEHKRELVTKTQMYPCASCSAPKPEPVLPPVLEKKPRKSRKKTVVA